MKHPAAVMVGILFFAAFMGFYFWLSNQPSATGLHHMTGNFFACHERSEIERIRQLINENDVDAAKQEAKDGVVQGACIYIDGGQAVYVEDITVSGLTKMRLTGDPTSYWTFSKLIGT